MKTSYDHIAGNPMRAKKILWKIAYYPLLIPLLVFIFFPFKEVLIIGIALSGTLFLIFGLASFSMRFAVKKFNDRMKKIESQDYLCKWTYSSSEWELFANEELQRRKLVSKKVFIGVMIVSFIIFLVLCYFLPERDVAFAFIFLFIMMIVMTTSFFLSKQSRNSWIKNAIKNVHGLNDCSYIDTNFLLRGGEYFSFGEIGVSLIKVRIENNRLIFTTRTQTSNTSVDKDIFVPIPENNKQEAEEILKIFSGAE